MSKEEFKTAEVKATINVAVEQPGGIKEMEMLGKTFLYGGRACFINIKESPVMNGILYTEQAISPADWELIRITRGHAVNMSSLASITIGFIAGVEYSGETGKLTADIYLDKELCKLRGALDTYDILSRGQRMDVSCTLWISESQEVKGEVDRVPYTLKALKIEPQSLGLMQEDKGACSQPYCGINSANSEESLLDKIKDFINGRGLIPAKNQEENQMKEGCNCQSEPAANSTIDKEEITEIVNAAVQSAFIKKEEEAELEAAKEEAAANQQKQIKEQVQKALTDILATNGLKPSTDINRVGISASYYPSEIKNEVAK